MSEISQIRIFDYLHQSTYSLKSDSNFFVHRSVFKYLGRYYPNKFHFYTTYDESLENTETMRKIQKQFPFVTPVPIKYYSTNAIFRNALDWKSLSANAPDVDIIWNNTPEINFELLSFFVSKGCYCPLISYSHWYAPLVDPPIYANYLKKQDEKYCVDIKYFFNYILAYKNYNNSKWGTDSIKKGYEVVPDLGWRDKVLNKIHPLYLTVDHEEIDQFKPVEIKKDVPIIVFNNRHNEYTGFTFFMNAVKKMIEIRPGLKFKIFMTAVGENDRSAKFEIPEEYFINKESLPFPKYIEQLWKCDIEIGAHTGDNQWSMSFLDGMFANLIPFYRRGVFFDEMFEGLDINEQYGFRTEDEFISKLIFMLENIQHFRDANKNIFEHFRKNWTWDVLIHEWAKMFQDAYDQQRITETEKIFNVDLSQFPMPWADVKQAMNISDQRNTTSYRKTLKEALPIKEDMNRPDIVFYRNDQNIKRQEKWF